MEGNSLEKGMVSVVYNRIQMWRKESELFSWVFQNYEAKSIRIDVSFWICWSFLAQDEEELWDKEYRIDTSIGIRWKGIDKSQE